MKLIIEIKNLTKEQHNVLETYSKSAMEFILDIKTVADSLPIKSIGFQLKRIEQALEYIIGIVDNIEAND